MALEAEPVEDRRRHRPCLDDEERRAAPDGVLPAGVDERPVDAAAARLGQHGAAHQRDALVHEHRRGRSRRAVRRGRRRSAVRPRRRTPRTVLARPRGAWRAPPRRRARPPSRSRAPRAARRWSRSGGPRPRPARAAARPCRSSRSERAGRPARARARAAARPGRPARRASRPTSRRSGRRGGGIQRESSSTAASTSPSRIRCTAARSGPASKKYSSAVDLVEARRAAAGAPAVSSASSSRCRRHGTLLSITRGGIAMTDVVDAPAAVKPINHWISGAPVRRPVGPQRPGLQPGDR